MVRSVRFAALDRGRAEKCVIVFQTDVDESLNGACNFLHEEDAPLHVQLLLGDQAAVEYDEFRVCEERVAAALQSDLDAALRRAERFVDFERNGGGFQSG